MVLPFAQLDLASTLSISWTGAESAVGCSGVAEPAALLDAAAYTSQLG